MRKPLSNPSLFVLVVILAFILLLSIGSTPANASQGETYSQIPQYRWPSFETIAAGTIVTESPSHDDALGLHAPYPGRWRSVGLPAALNGATIDGASTGLIDTLHTFTAGSFSFKRDHPNHIRLVAATVERPGDGGRILSMERRR